MSIMYHCDVCDKKDYDYNVEGRYAKIIEVNYAGITKHVCSMNCLDEYARNHFEFKVTNERADSIQK
jgi:hypothetical protein